MTEFSYFEYIYKSEEVIFYSLGMRRDGYTAYLNFAKSKQGMRNFPSTHPVREKMRECHEDEFS